MDINSIITTLWYLVPIVFVLTFMVEHNVRYSSVWCSEIQNQLRTCHFRNLYYDTDHGFSFLLDEASVFSGISDPQELKELKLSPIADHKGVNMKISMVRSSDTSPYPRFSNIFWFLKDNNVIKEPHFLVYRFKPDNFMHVVHDDLIPLFFKLRDLSMGNVVDLVTKTNLFFVDKNDRGPFAEWYQPLSSQAPLLAKEMLPGQSYCFSSAYIGLSNTSFFQYGFNKPQGPIEPKLSGRDVEEFRNYFLDYFNIKPHRVDNIMKVTVISRRINRKILNEEKILKTFEDLCNADSFYKNKTIVVSKGDMMADRLIHLVASSDILVGMHGAETVLCLFLPTSSLFIELFPFGISRDNVSPVYSLSKVKDVHFKYLSWHNTNENNSFPHPEYPEEFGGIEAFSSSVKNEIYATKQVPAVSCCGNPVYLFRMYQDTILDDSFTETASTALKLLRVRDPTPSTKLFWFFPDEVRNLNCHRLDDHVTISWMAPYNVANIHTRYDVVILADFVQSDAVTNELSIRFDIDEGVELVQVWVSAEANGKRSIDSYCKCKQIKTNHEM